MNKQIERGLIFLIGGAIGAATTFIIMKKKQQKDNEELFKLLDQEEADLKARVKELESIMDISTIYKDTEINPADEEKTEDSESKKVKETGEHIIRGLGRGFNNVQKTDYSQCYPNSINIANGFDFDDVEDLAEMEHPIEDDTVIDPYIISRSEFDNENPFYNKSYITYYAQDDILADEHEEIIDDVYGNVGDSALHAFGDNNEDADIVYVRNDNRGIDFEITKIDGSYHELILGIYDKE